ncbi:chemotaxis protein CheV [Lysinibacillus sphaericus]|uniref:Chemotaxis protein CheV n=3 Tax=Lysinibacillus TaxID=400634 RepID=A0A2S0K4D5_LYSSH|nr:MULTISPECIES: chemotaxis protein [Lysinibacillus]AHN20698.1 chemotaxis protein CheV [Lysinibacillus varians]AVK98233.1 chemotaxis protein CheV [Lysinibacillus sphaericus]MED4543739.1 chemotaxis protein [Lysinibacillus sphaericus]TKI19228.1 chemotaxis protein CheV [Lysinibacillus sphaericus]TKI48619.1 chemotaxis protein CheV [Lysinibacillus tabacifolii]
MEHKGILLESGTNELEIVEFEVANNKFGINVIKVKEIIQPIPVTFIPHAHPHVEGIIQLRGEVLPVVDMLRVLGIQSTERNPQQKYIVAEFNKQRVVFHVDNVTQIHRISWDQIEKPSDMYQGGTSQVIGVIKQNEQMILLLDFEKIMVDINPESGINVESVKKLGKRERSEKRILIAEDSPLLRKLLFDTMKEAGYENVEFFENGRDAYEYLDSLAKSGNNVTEHIQLVVTDIEMPQMDGHHLTRKIKEHPDLQKLPVIIFSSLITDDLRHKGDQVGAEDQISKPEIAELILRVDQLIL